MTTMLLLSKNRFLIVYLPSVSQMANPIIDPDKYTEWENGEPILDDEYDALYA